MIRRIIVEDVTGKHVMSRAVKSCTEEDVHKAFAKAGLPVMTFSVDIVGVALVVVGKRLGG